MPDIKLHKLRDDIVITRQIQQGDVFYVIKNPDDQSYYRFPEIQYEIIALFNGKNDFSAIKGEFEAKHPDVEIDDTTLNSFLASLKELNLLEKTAAEKNLMLLEKTRAFRKGKIIEAKGSLFYKRIPIVDPDWFFSRTINYIQFFWTKRFFVISLLSIILSYIIIALNWEKVHEGIKAMYSFTSMSFENIVLLWITVLAVIALHECGHGYTCKYFGGEVHEIGFLFLFFQPCMFCNVNDAWTFEKKSQRLLVTFGGPYFEAFIGAIATFVWWATNPGTGINSICYRVLTVCGISSLAFNFNPLIRLDGYYALSDYLETPNLRQNASDYVNSFIKRKIFRMNVPEKSVTVYEQKIYLIYGLLQKVYIVVLLGTLFTIFGGLLVGKYYEMGVIILFALFGLIFKSMITNFIKSCRLFYTEKKGLLKKRPYATGLSVATAILILLSIFGRMDVEVTSRCVLEPITDITIRAKTSGFIREVYVNEGDTVVQGDRVISIENPDHVAHLKQIRLEKAQIEEQLQRSYGQTDIASSLGLQVKSRQNAVALQEAIRQLQYGEVVSPIDGVVTSARMKEIRGMYVKEGDDLCEVADISTMKAVVSIEEGEMGYLSHGDPAELRVLSAPGVLLTGKVKRFSPVADSGSGVMRNFLATIEVKNRDHLLRSGMEGVAKIRTARIRPIHYVAWRLARIIRVDLWF